jgi:hypothetical protein
VAVRDGLYRAMREAFGRAGIRWVTAVTRTVAMVCSSWFRLRCLRAC